METNVKTEGTREALAKIPKEEREKLEELLSREALEDGDWQRIYEFLSGYELYTVMDRAGRIRPWNGTYLIAFTRAPLTRFASLRDAGLRVIPTSFADAASSSVRGGIPMRIWVSRAMESRGLYYNPKGDELTITDLTGDYMRI